MAQFFDSPAAKFAIEAVREASILVRRVQAEMIAALTDGLGNQPSNAAYRTALTQTFQFVNTHMTDPRTGIWVDSVTSEGAPKAPGLAHNWKANYHDVRALVKFVDAFDPQKPAPRK